MNDLTTWTYENTEVRTIEKDGETWWVLADICKVLELSNPTRVASRLDEDERSNLELGRQGKATIINESGLYSVILRSDKPQAKPFRRWVTHDILPQIRRTGSYNALESVLSVESYIRNTCNVLGLHEPIMSADVVCLADIPEDYYLSKAWDSLILTYGFAPNSKDIIIDDIIQKKTVFYLYFHVGRQDHYFQAKFKKHGQKWWLSDFNHTRTSPSQKLLISKGNK